MNYLELKFNSEQERNKFRQIAEILKKPEEDLAAALVVDAMNPDENSPSPATAFYSVEADDFVEEESDFMQLLLERDMKNSMHPHPKGRGIANGA